MTIHALFLEWDTISIQDKMVQFLETQGYDVRTSLGFMNFDMTGDSALCIDATLDRVCVAVQIENQKQLITIRGGLIGTYLPEGKKIPKFKQEFKHTEITEASKFFIKVVKWCTSAGESQ